MREHMNAFYPANNRILIGFDIRKSGILAFFMTSYDPSVRHEMIYDDYQAFLNGCNFFYCDPTTIASLKLPSNSYIVAFDLEEKVIKASKNRSYSVLDPLPEKVDLAEWFFLGFDIVDIVTQTSALYGFDGEVFRTFLDNHHCVLNQYGLFNDQDQTKMLIKSFDLLFPEHAPFSCAGIWLKQTSIG
jgi:hypothetical protein